jgi:hypothetical protein
MKKRVFVLILVASFLFVSPAQAAPPAAPPIDQLWVKARINGAHVWMTADASNFTGLQSLDSVPAGRLMGVVSWKDNCDYVVVSSPMSDRQNMIQVVKIGAEWEWVRRPPSQRLWVQARINGAQVWMTADASNFTGLQLLGAVPEGRRLGFVSWNNQFVVVSPPMGDHQNMVQVVRIGAEWEWKEPAPVGKLFKLLISPNPVGADGEIHLNVPEDCGWFYFEVDGREIRLSVECHNLGDVPRSAQIVYPFAVCPQNSSNYDTLLSFEEFIPFRELLGDREWPYGRWYLEDRCVLIEKPVLTLYYMKQ